MSYYILSKSNCIQTKKYQEQGIDTFKANPFDKRELLFAPNHWCSNELIMRDPELRSLARVQPLDTQLDKSLMEAHAFGKSAGLVKHH